LNVELSCRPTFFPPRLGMMRGAGVSSIGLIGFKSPDFSLSHVRFLCLFASYVRNNVENYRGNHLSLGCKDNALADSFDLFSFLLPVLVFVDFFTGFDFSVDFPPGVSSLPLPPGGLTE